MGLSADDYIAKRFAFSALDYPPKRRPKRRPDIAVETSGNAYA
jgi:hypothetical protein